MSPLVAKSLLGTTVTQGTKSKDRSIFVSLFPFGAHRLVCKARKELRESLEQRFDSAHASTPRALKKVTYFDYSPTTEKVNRRLSSRDAAP
jgi:hypothetical protein